MSEIQYVVEIEWEGRWVIVWDYADRDDGEWAIARWRQEHGGSGRDTGLRCRRLGEEPT